MSDAKTLRRRAGIDLLMRLFLYKDGLIKKEETDRVRLVRETIWNGLELQHYCCCFIIHRI